MTQFFISALGSYGDVHPMVGLGSALVERGHRVKIFTNPYFADVVAAARLELVPLGTAADYSLLSQHPDLWHPVRGPRLVLMYASHHVLRPLYERLVEHYAAGTTVFCAHGLDLASRVAAEKLAAPVASIDFAPGMLWTLYDSPRLKGALLGPGVPKWAKRAQFWASDTLFVRPLLGPPLNRLRRELGLRSVQRIFSHWLHATDLTLGLYPDWFGPPQPDWPKNVRLVGFPLWDGGANSPVLDELQAFLTAGPPPVVFSPGSANKVAHRFFEAAVEACNRLGCRGLLLTKYDHQLPARLPDSVRHFGFVPMSRVLPRAAALVHHGGIGSCAQGLAAGVPHLVQPMSYDQFDNSRRLVRLGVAAEISVRLMSGRSVADALARLVDSPEVAARCRGLARQCDGAAALAAASRALEELADSQAAR